jgi:hypothetical protein
MRKPAIVAAVAVALFLAYIIYSSLEGTQVTCEVCITFRGTTQCRSAAGVDNAEAQRTATDMACAVLGSNMSEGIACGNTPPSRLMCKER